LSAKPDLLYQEAIMNSNTQITELFGNAQACLDKGQLEDATSLYSEVCSLDPDNAEAWLMLAAISGESGNLADAVKHAKRAVDSDNEYAEAHFTLAQLLNALGNGTEALQSARQAVACDGDFSEAWLLLGAISGQLGDYELAESANRKAVELLPDSADAHVNLGGVLQHQGKYAEAEQSFRRALDLQPGMDNILPNLGYVLVAQNKFAQALAPLIKAVEMDPHNPEFHLRLGDVREKLHQPDGALACYMKALSLEPGGFAARYRAGAVLEAQGKYEESLQHYRYLADAFPDDANVVAAQAGIYERLGKREEAAALLDPLIAEGRATPRVALVFSRFCHYLDRCDEILALLEGFLSGLELGDGVKADILFAIGAIRDRRNEYDKAFQRFEEANKLRRGEYDPEAYAGQVDQFIEVFSAERLESAPRSGKSAIKPIFIVGMPRSGSSLVEQIIAAHPDVCAVGETRAIFELAETMQQELGSEHPYPVCFGDLTEQAVESLKEEYLSRLPAEAQGFGWVTDKMLHNFMHLGLISTLFPNAVIIHCVRNPLDTCLSSFFHDFSGYHPYTYDMRSLGSHYRQYQRLMGHWKNTCRLPMLDVVYEDLVSDPERRIREIISYCQLKWDERCLRFHESDRVAATASYDQVRKPVYQSSIGRWKHYEEHVAPLIEMLGQ
jgi:tetratricopeptide (TPR) repeat protein